MEITKKEVEQLIHLKKENSFWTHLSGILGNNLFVSGSVSSTEVQLWQRNQWTMSLYAVFTFSFNAQHHLIDIKTELNIFGKILVYGIFAVLVFFFIPKDMASFQQNNFWIFTCIKVIFLSIYVILCKVLYESEKRIQRKAIFEKLAIEITEENPIKETSLFSIFIRILTYPLGLMTLYACVFHFFPNQKYIYGTLGIVVVSAYFITDIILLFRKKKR
ncbi:hypothetical protein [uncultured Kordia sp.]|uniref:hypothetical protein n=1 Tax=uncultured Kordia sp. TaxID=507699 RepID=UPI00262BCE08|nr:hypothetical protein [uncultured Kordia sp.]